MDVPQIKGRVEFLSSYLATKVPIGDKRKYAMALIVFSLFIENVSLFSQFAIILSFTRFKGYMKNTSNIINWTTATHTHTYTHTHGDQWSDYHDYDYDIALLQVMIIDWCLVFCFWQRFCTYLYVASAPCRASRLCLA